MRRAALCSLTLLLLVAAGGVIGKAIGRYDPYGGAFTGPCIVEPHSAQGTATKLTLTDHGPPVTVGHISVANFDANGRALATTRLNVGVWDVVVVHDQTRTYRVAAPKGTASCKLADWGEPSPAGGQPS